MGCCVCRISGLCTYLHAWLHILFKKLGACLFFFFFSNHSSLLTQFSSFITHHLKYPNFPNPTRLDIVFCSHHSKFSTFCGPIPVIWGSFYNFFFPFNPQYPNSLNVVKKKKKNTHTHTQKPKLTEPSEGRRRKRKRKRKEEEEDHLVWKEKEKRRRRRTQTHRTQWKKKKKVKSCSWALTVGPLVRV